MIELLQNFQEGLGAFVFPVLIGLGILLVFIVAFYAIGVFLHRNNKRTREALKSSWQHSFREYQEQENGSNLDNLPETGASFYDYRDDFLQTLKAANFEPEKTLDIYRRTGYYTQDKADISSRTWWRRVQALYRLKYTSLAGLEDRLSLLIYDPNLEVRLNALDALSYTGKYPELDPIKLFKTFSEKLDSYLIIKLSALKPDENFLRPLVESEKPRLRRAGATLLGQPKETDFAPLLEELTRDDDIRVRINVAESLGRIGKPDNIRLLKKTSNDTVPTVREASARSLGGILHEDSTEILDDLAGDEDFRVRLAAFSSLAQFGETGRNVITNYWSQDRRLAREAIFESYQE